MNIDCLPFVISVWLLVAAPSLTAPWERGQGPPPASSDLITIDGSKNPEQVPQWAAWHFAFAQIRGVNDIPSDVLGVIVPAERRAILDAAQKDGRFYAEGEKRVKAIQASVIAEPDRAKQMELLRSLQPKVDELELEARRHTLELRDHLLSILRPAGRAALIAWVEASKAGHRITMPRSRLAAYRKPE